MKQLKRTVLLLVALVLAMGALSVSAFAAGTPTVAADSYTGEPLEAGETATLAVRFNDFVPFYGFTFLVDYDRDALELTDIGCSYINSDDEESYYVTDSTIVNLTYPVEGNEGALPDGVKVGQSYGFIMSTSGTKRIEKLKQGGTIFTLTLKAKSVTEAKNAWVKPILWKLDDIDADNNFIDLVPQVTCRQTGISVAAAETPVTYCTVTFTGDYTGTQQVEKGKDAVLPPAPEGYAYSFAAEDGTAWDGRNIQGDVTVVVTKTRLESVYTVMLVPDKTEAACGEIVKVDVKITGAAYNGVDMTLTYDTGLFTYVSATEGNLLNVAENSGSIRIKKVGGDLADGSVLTTLTFTAATVAQPASGSFTITAAKVVGQNDAMTANAPQAAVENCSVRIVPEFLVRFLDRNGSELAQSRVSHGGTVLTVPTAPTVDYYDFAGWISGGRLYQADEILKLAVTGPVTYQASYTAKTYSVIHNGTAGGDTATYGEAYTGSISEFDGDNYDYEVRYTVGGNEMEAEVNGDGTFTIPGGNITGNITISVSRTIKGVTVELYEDYVGGYTLIVVKGGAAAYAYDGDAMYQTPAYGETAFAWIVEGETTETDVLAKLATAAAAKAVIPANSYDVNMAGDGVVDISDAQAVYNMYNITAGYPVADCMEKYLRADVNADHCVDVADLNIVLEQI